MSKKVDALLYLSHSRTQGRLSPFYGFIYDFFPHSPSVTAITCGLVEPGSLVELLEFSFRRVFRGPPCPLQRECLTYPQNPNLTPNPTALQSFRHPKGKPIYLIQGPPGRLFTSPPVQIPALPTSRDRTTPHLSQSMQPPNRTQLVI